MSRCCKCCRDCRSPSRRRTCSRHRDRHRHGGGRAAPPLRRKRNEAQRMPAHCSSRGGGSSASKMRWTSAALPWMSAFTSCARLRPAPHSSSLRDAIRTQRCSWIRCPGKCELHAMTCVIAARSSVSRDMPPDHGERIEPHGCTGRTARLRPKMPVFGGVRIGANPDPPQAATRTRPAFNSHVSKCQKHRHSRPTRVRKLSKPSACRSRRVPTRRRASRPNRRGRS